jgi:predicted aconitase with swiveling domain
MSQGPLGVSITNVEGSNSKLNLTAGATLVKPQPGRILSLVINTPGSTTTTPSVVMYDSATTAGTATANIVYASPDNVAAGTVIPVNFPVQNGLVVVPETGCVCSLSYN